jgi:hypothetical protein
MLWGCSQLQEMTTTMATGDEYDDDDDGNGVTGDGRRS